MKTKIQIKSIFGKLLFEFEKENNSVKETLTKAVTEGANLRGANLRYANLYGVDLRGVDLRGVDLRGVDLRGADLRGADLRDADLRDADLRGANLRGTNLRDADLRDADLRYADLYGVDLRGVDLRGADLRGADLRDADLRDADLRGANLRGTNLRYADLDFNSLSFQQTRILPEGDIIGYKKCQNNVIVKLLIPSTAKRSQAFGRKCRAEFAKVVEIIGADEATSTHDSSFTYKVGDEVRPKNGWDDNWQNECAPGIHFFITKVEAENY